MFLLYSLLMVPPQAPTPPQAPRPKQAPPIVERKLTTQERWTTAYEEVKTGKRTHLNIGKEFPSGWLGLDDGDYHCQVIDGKPYIQLLQPKPAPQPVQTHSLTLDYTITPRYQPVIECRT